MLNLSNVYMNIYLPAKVVGTLTVGDAIVLGEELFLEGPESALEYFAGSLLLVPRPAAISARISDTKRAFAQNFVGNIDRPAREVCASHVVR